MGKGGVRGTARKLPSISLHSARFAQALDSTTPGRLLAIVEPFAPREVARNPHEAVECHKEAIPTKCCEFGSTKVGAVFDLLAGRKIDA